MIDFAVGRIAFLSAIAALACAEFASATIINLAPTRDATLFQSSTGALSGGGDDRIFAGRSEQTIGLQIRRALLAFDFSTIPAGSTINSASLRLRVEIA